MKEAPSGASFFYFIYIYIYNAKFVQCYVIHSLENSSKHYFLVDATLYSFALSMIELVLK